MSSLFRSEEMTLCEILLHKDNAFDCLAELGRLSLAQFNNLVSDAGDGDVTNFQFTNEVLRCHDLNRILQNIETQLKESQIKPLYRSSDELPKVHDLNDIEVILQQLGRELCDVERNYQRLRKQKNKLLEKWHVLTKADQFLQGNECQRSVLATNWSDNLIVSLLHDETTYDNEADRLLRLGFLTGSIKVERFHSFEVMLWRVTYGNFFMRSSEIGISLEDAGSVGNDFVKKKAFMVFFQGESMRKKIFKVCQGFDSNLVECPESRKERTFRRKMLVGEYDDLKIVLHQTQQHRQRLLEFAAKDLVHWKRKIKKILMIYFTLNKLDAVENLEHKNFFRAECWIPTTNIPLVRNALHRGARKCSKNDEELIFPPILSEKLQKFCTAPTYFRLNSFTQVFQNLIDSYGVAAYRELNPAPYTIVTFPFLFGVMFGDVGHGLIITIFSIYMILQAKRNGKRHSRLEVVANTNEIWNLLFAGRYIILLMGIFSIYTGLIYNEVFSKGFCLFGGSRWKIVYDEHTVASHKSLQLDPRDPQVYLGEPYEFGMDPVWDVSRESAIIMYNSLKMKLSIILGVAQMLFGLSLGAFNNIHARNYIDLWLISIPKIVFFLCLFGYLVFLIFYKWSAYGGYHESPYDSACAPSILVTFIDMVIMRGRAEEHASNLDNDVDEGSKECSKYMFPGQYGIQLLLMITAILCVPVILMGKPLYYMYRKHKVNVTKEAEERERLIESEHIDHIDQDHQIGSLDCQLRQIEIAKTENELSDLWIHQVILCIESVLGSVSHTASYLRLWALSLAHDQLSAVLWSMLLTLPLAWDLGWLAGIAMYFTFLMWSFLTVTILVMMEGLSAFLHTLRLHWVEFQSKFYYGSGIKFTPFSFDQCKTV